MENLSDEILMKNVRNGRLEDLSVIFDRYHVLIYNFFLRMGAQREMSEDLTQNLFYRILKYRESYREGESVRTWIFQIARNLYYNQYKELRKNDSIFTLTDNYITDVPEDEAAFSEDDFRRLDKALLLLDPGERELLVMSRFQGLKYSEVSLLVNQSVPAIKVGIFRALKKLRTIYFKQV
jgi:RNA polymerase sigma factor (sigma-70 family)